MKVAALDLGSNTFLLLIAEVEKSKVTQIYCEECQVTRLGQGVDETREFHQEALERAKNCLCYYGGLIKQHQPEKVMAVATSAVRDVKNHDEFFAIASANSIPVKVISGDMEARMTFMGALSDLVSDQNYWVIDVGGGSTEIIFGSKNHLQGQSLDLGCVRLTEQFITAHPISSEELSRMREFTCQQLKVLNQEASPGQGPIVAVAGTPTTLAAVLLEVPMGAEKIHGFEINLDTLKIWIKRLAGMTVEERAQLPGMEPLRADVIVAGLVILSEATQHLGGKSVLVSTRGVRYGLALEMENEDSRLLVD